MKNVLTLFSVLTLLACSLFLCFTASAAEYADFTVALEAGEVQEDGTVSVDVVIYNNPGFAGCQFDIVFDNTKIQVIDYDKYLDENGVYWPASSFSGGKIGTNLANPAVNYEDLNNITANFARATSTRKNGVLMNITFQLCDGVESADLCIDNEMFIDEGQSLITELTLVPATVEFPTPDYTGECGDDLTWELYLSWEKLIISGTGEMYNYSSSNGSPWKEYMENIKAVTVSQGVTSIGDCAFYNLKNALSIALPEGIVNIGTMAFYNCNRVSKITIPESVESIGDNAFHNLPIFTANLPANVNNIGTAIFNNCVFLSEITVDDANPNYCSVDGVLYDKDMTILIQGPGAKKEYQAIPDSVKTIAPHAFASGRVMSITIPDSVINIEKYAFSGCSRLTSITIPAGVENIAKDAFVFCSNLVSIVVDDDNESYKSVDGILYDKNITTLILAPAGITECNNIPSSVTCIGEMAFSLNAKLESVTIPSHITTIGNYAFEYCLALCDVIIPESVTNIGDYAFNCSGIVRIKIPASVNSIGESAFEYCPNLQAIYLYRGSYADTYCLADSDLASKVVYFDEPDYSGKCGDALFWELSMSTGTLVIYGKGEMYDFSSENRAPWYEYRENIEKVKILSGVTSIGKTAFVSCNNLSNIEIADCVTSIGDYTFNGCTSLVCITIPKSTTDLGIDFLQDCSSLESINVDEGNPNYCSLDGLLYDKNQTTLVCVPRAIVDCPAISSSVTIIGDYAFHGCEKLSQVTLPENVTCIGSSAFYNCVSLVSVSIPGKVTSLGYSAFSYCASLTNIIIPDSVVSIGSYPFMGCTSLEAITVGGNNSTFCSVDGILYDKSKTTLIQAPGAITECVNIPDSVTTIGFASFTRCEKIESIRIPEGVTEIVAGAFMYCSSLKEITILDSVEQIGFGILAGCMNLESIYLFEGSYAEQYCLADSELAPKIVYVTHATGVSLNKTSVSLNIGDSFELVATVSPDNAINKVVIWTSSNISVATVDKNGVVTAKSPGTATITAKTEDGGMVADCLITVYPSFSLDELTLSLGSVKTVAGQTVNVKLSLSNNMGIAGMSFDISYDSSVMTMINYTCEDPWLFTTNFDEDNQHNPASFVWSNPSNIEINGQILTLTFEIKEDAPVGNYEIKLTKNGVVTNQDLDVIPCNIFSGNIIIVEQAVGDITNDGDIDARDAVLIAQYLAGWDVSVDESAADCNADGQVNAIDAVLLAQYLANWDVTLGSVEVSIGNEQNAAATVSEINTSAESENVVCLNNVNFKRENEFEGIDIREIVFKA